MRSVIPCVNFCLADINNRAASEEVMKSIVDESEEPPKPKKRALKRAREVTVDEEQDSDEYVLSLVAQVSTSHSIT